jgi:uncharacterized protein
MSVEGSTTVRAPSTLLKDVADLLRRPGASEPARLRAHIDGLRMDLIEIPGDIEADLRFDSIVEGIAVSGTIDVEARGVCSRCTDPITFHVQTRVDEAFTVDAAPDDETYPITQEMIDLEPLLRDAILLSLPLHPLCRPDCDGLCPVCGEARATSTCGHDTKPNDPRWDALKALRAEQDEMEE